MCRIVIVFSAIVILSGCNQTDEKPKKAVVTVQGVREELIALNTKAATELAKAEDLHSFLTILDNRGEAVFELNDKVEQLSADDQAMLDRKNVKLDQSRAKLAEAIDAFHKRVLAKGNNPQVLIETSQGPIRVELYEKLAPITVKNFLTYTDEKFYDGTIFHRVIPNFMIQGGGFEPGMQEKRRQLHAPIKNEAYNRLSNVRGTLAMARTPDPDSASAQFYINVAENNKLDRGHAADGVGYAVFGKVVEGMEVVDKIKMTETEMRAGHDDVPVTDVIIKSVRRIDEKK